jgi:site-specific recombinase XerD
MIIDIKKERGCGALREETMADDLISAEPSGALATLSERARAYINASARPNTRRAYATQLRQWIAWSATQGVAAFPAEPTFVANYLAERGAGGRSSSTLRILVAAIKAGHEANGLAFDTKAPAITRTLRGIRNSAPKLPRQAEPMRGFDVLELVTAADASPIGRRDAALLALGYVFALRRSELVALDLESQGSGDGALKIKAKTIEIAFARSKTSGGEVEVVAVPREENCEAVKAIERWIALVGIKPGEAILRRVTKGGLIGGRLHPQSVSNIIKARVAEYHMRRGVPAEAANAEGQRFSGHSLRVGFSVTAAEAGADIRAIASVTRHKSMAMPARYAQKAEQVRTSPHRLKGVG